MFEAQEEEQNGRDNLGSNSIQHWRSAGQFHEHTQTNDTQFTVVEPGEWTRES